MHRASTAPEREALWATADIARRVRPPGMVRVVEVDETELDGSVVLTVVVDEPEGPTVAERPPADAAAFRDLADALARVHSAGMAHGAVDAAHIRCDAAGRAVLPFPTMTGSIADDVAALQSLVHDRTARSAREIADRLTTSPPRLLTGRRLRKRGRAVVGLLAVVAGVALIAASTMTPSGARPATRAQRPPAHPAATVPASTNRVVEVDGKRYEVGGAAGDLVVVGWWDCADTPSPALVRPSDGNVFVFDGFEPSATTTPVTRIDGITGAGRATDARGCHLLVVDTVTGPTVVDLRS